MCDQPSTPERPFRLPHNSLICLSEPALAFILALSL